MIAFISILSQTHDNFSPEFLPTLSQTNHNFHLNFPNLSLKETIDFTPFPQTPYWDARHFSPALHTAQLMDRGKLGYRRHFSHTLRQSTLRTEPNSSWQDSSGKFVKTFFPHVLRKPKIHYHVNKNDQLAYFEHWQERVWSRTYDPISFRYILISFHLRLWLPILELY